MAGVPCWLEEVTGDASLAIEVARESASALGDLPRETLPEGDEPGTGCGLEGDEVCLWPYIALFLSYASACFSKPSKGAEGHE